MTIPVDEEAISGPYDGNGSAVQFDYNFKVYQDSEVLVVRENADGTYTTLTLTSDYTVNGANSDSNRYITLTSAALLPTGARLTIEPNIEQSQTRPLGEQSSTNLEELEDALDKLTSMTRQALGLLQRAVILPSFYDGSTETDQPLAGRVLQMNAALDKIIFGPTVGEIESAAQAATDAIAAQAAAEAAQAGAEAAENSLLVYVGAWQTATAYSLGNIVTEDGSSYVCVSAHTSGVFATDLAASRWSVLASRGAAGPGSGDTLNSNNLSDMDNAGVALFNIGGYPRSEVETAVVSSETDFNDLVVGGPYTISGSWANGPLGAASTTYTAVADVKKRFYSAGASVVQIVYMLVSGEHQEWTRVGTGDPVTWSDWTRTPGAGEIPNVPIAAWCSFDGLSASPITPDAGLNVDNVTFDVTDGYEVNFTNDLADTNYAFLISADGATGGSTGYSYSTINNNSVIKAVDSFRFKLGYGANTGNYGLSKISVLILR